jgi:hypothetical protein
VTGASPTPDFARVSLEIATVRSGRVFGRIHRVAYPDPLGFGKNATRFSDPRRRIEANRFGVLYLGSTLKVCFLEAVLRDQRDGLVGAVEVDETEITDRLYSEVAIDRALKLVDLRGDAPVKMGMPSDVVRGRTQTLARKWSLAIHDHPAAVDGIIYPSRLSNEVNLAVYDRAVLKLAPHSTGPLNRAPNIGRLLTDFQVALV